MRIVLSQDVPGLGQAGQVKDVADGYARNYLLPRKLAVPATEGALKTAAARQAAEARRQEHDEQVASSEAQRIAATPLLLRAKVGEQHRLYGSITSSDIAEALEREWGQEFDKRRIDLTEPIRRVGSFEVPVHLHKNVVARVTVEVQPEETGG